MEIKGTIKVIKDIQQVSEKFQKREFVVESNEQYPQTICVELQGNNVDIIDAYTIGESVIVDINLRGRLWTNPQGEDKYFNTIVAWRIQKESSQPVNNTTTQTAPQEFKQAAQPNSFADGPDDDSDLPF